MKLNWAERLIVNNPVRVMIQRLIVKWIGRGPDAPGQNPGSGLRPGRRGLPHPGEFHRPASTPWTWTIA